VLDEATRPDELHVGLHEWEADLVGLLLGVEATLDAVVDKSDEARGDNNTERTVR
jgi:hypothetical protein